MNIDSRIKQELDSESAEIDRIVGPDPGLWALLGGSLRSGMRRWVVIGNLLAAIGMGVYFWRTHPALRDQFTHALDHGQRPVAGGTR